MLRGVDADLLLVIGNTQPEELIDHLEDNKRHHEGIAHSSADADELPAQLARFPVNEASAASNRGDGKDARRERAPGAAHAVHADDIERVVQFQPDPQLDRAVAERSGADTNRDRRHRIDESCGRCNRHQASNSACCRPNCAGLAVELPAQEHPGHHCRRRRDEGDDEGVGRNAVRTERAACIKAKPAEPEQRRAQEHERDVVRLHRVFAVASALSVEQRRHKSRSARVDVHDRSTGEVERAVLEQPAAVSPDPVGDRRIDDERPDRHEEQERAKLRPFREGARDERRRDDGERHLKDHEHQVWNRRGIRPWFLADILQTKVVKIADEPSARVRPEGQRIADDDP